MKKDFNLPWDITWVRKAVFISWAWRCPSADIHTKEFFWPMMVVLLWVKLILEDEEPDSSWIQSQIVPATFLPRKRKLSWKVFLILGRNFHNRRMAKFEGEADMDNYITLIFFLKLSLPLAHLLFYCTIIGQT